MQPAELEQLAAMSPAALSVLLRDAASEGSPDLLRFVLQRMPDVSPAHEEAFWAAAATGHASCLTALLERPAGRDRLLSAADEEGRTALILAAEYGHAPCVRALLAHSPEPQVAAVAKIGRHTALMRAVYAGHEQCVDELLCHAPSRQVVVVDYMGRTPLMAAATEGSEGCMARLLRHDPLTQVRARMGAAGQSPGANALMLACAHAPHGCVAQLLRHAPDEQVKAEDAKGHTALHFVLTGNFSLSCVRQLLAHSPEAQLAGPRGDFSQPALLRITEWFSQPDFGGEAGLQDKLECLRLVLGYAHPQMWLNYALEAIGQAVDKAALHQVEELNLMLRLLLSKGAMLPRPRDAWDEAQAAEPAVWAVVRDLAAQAELPDAINKAVLAQAVVGLAGAVRGQQAEAAGAGSVEAAGAGSVEAAGAGSVEAAGAGSVEAAGAGSVEAAGAGSVEAAGGGRKRKAAPKPAGAVGSRGKRKAGE